MREGLPHIVLTGFNRKEKFKSKSIGRNPEIPFQDRASHGSQMLSSYNNAIAIGASRKENSKPLTTESGIYLEIISFPDCSLQLDSLDSSKGYKLKSLHLAENREIAVIFVPDSKRSEFSNKIEAYLNPDKDVHSKKHQTSAPKNRKLIDSIETIKLASLRSFWTDVSSKYPSNDETIIWWEVWLSWGPNMGSPLDLANRLAERIGAQTTQSFLTFFNSAVFLLKCSASTLQSAPELIGNLAELRLAQASPNLSITLSARDQTELSSNLRSRTTFKPGSTASVCILDTGVNYNNPLLSLACSREKSECWDASWNHFDNYLPGQSYNDHGSRQAGLALYGAELQELLFLNTSVEINYHIESGRILPETGSNDPKLYGAVTVDTANKIEIVRPSWNRVYSLAVTATPSGPSGIPSSWSAEIDYFSSGYQDEKQRLFVISAGNNASISPHTDYWDQVNLSEIEDPAQSWNALTVGACTFLTTVDDPTFKGWAPFAHPGDISPSSRSSLNWNWRKQAPYKPEIVAEGGNRLISPCGTSLSDADCVSILTTSGRSSGLVLETTKDTSAASGLVSRDAAILIAEYPNFWPETIRGLLVHSAEWSQQMMNRYQTLQSSHSLSVAKEVMLRTVGHGVVNLRKAQHSASNLLTLISQEEIKPFIKEQSKSTPSSDAKLNEMTLYDLPWPIETLQSLQGTTVKLRVTLSYFIEPNPGRKGYRSRYSYQSHGLRFEVIRPEQSLQNFKRFVNGLVNEDSEDYDGPEGDNSGWNFGPNLRKRGSLHTDFWVGDASQLSNMRYIAVYPVGGWWKYKTSGDSWKKVLGTASLSP